MTWFHFDPQSFAFSFLSVLFESVPVSAARRVGLGR